MKVFRGIFLMVMAGSMYAQDFELPPIDSNILSPTIQSPLYQSFEVNEFDLLVQNVNVFAPPKGESDFNFLEASARNEGKPSYQQYYSAIERQMAQYANFKVEINNSKSAPWIDYHDQPIYSGSNRVRNDAYQRADRLSGNRTVYPYYVAPSLTARRGMFWY